VRGYDGATYGLDSSIIPDLVADADLFLCVSGGLVMREEYLRSPRKVLIDTDPGWNHFVVWRQPGANYRAFDHHFTYAERIGQPGCGLPSLEIEWHPTRPPVVLDLWRQQDPGLSWTTVMTWDNYARAIEDDGVSYGSKDLEFAAVEDMPRRSDARLEIAIGGVRPPIDDWRGCGWSVVDAGAISCSPDSYRSYVQGSRGEFSVAKNVYVSTRSGWFSCRSVCYLAAGRPVVLQDTGFSSELPVGAGLLAFSTPDEARLALAQAEGDYERHSQAAREVASSCFGSDAVLGALLERTGLG
jgi:hypothetical protein